MRIPALARTVSAILFLASLSTAALAAETQSPTPIKKTYKLAAQITLKNKDAYQLDAFKADIDRLEKSLSVIKAQPVKLNSKEKLKLLLDTIDVMLFRQYCDSNDVRIPYSEAQLGQLLTQEKGRIFEQIKNSGAKLAPGATADSVAIANLYSQGVFVDFGSYERQELLISSFLEKAKEDELQAIKQPKPAEILKAYKGMSFDLRRPACARFTMLVADTTKSKSEAEKKKVGDAMRAIAAKVKADPSAMDEYIASGTFDPKAAGFNVGINVVMPMTGSSEEKTPVIYNAVSKLKEGEASDLLEDSQGYYIVRVGALLPEKQVLRLDDWTEGLQSASPQSSATTVLAYVLNKYQTSKYAKLKESAWNEIIKSLRGSKVPSIALNLGDLSEVLEPSEIDAIKSLKDSGYSIVLQ